MNDKKTDMSEYLKNSSLGRFGIRSWLLLGIIGAAAIILLVVDVLRPIVVPLVLAIFIGPMFMPIVDKLEKWHLPRFLASTLTMLLIVIIALGVLAMVVYGIIDQSDEIGASLGQAVGDIKEWADDINVNPGYVETIRTAVSEHSSEIAGGLAAYIVTGFDSVIAFIVGAFLGIIMLFMLFNIPTVIDDWIIRNAGRQKKKAEALLEIYDSSIRAYFKGTTIIAAFNAAIMAVAVAILGIPLIGAITVLTFLFAYIPFFGAFVAGAFAALIALGTGGVTDAIIIIIVALVSNNALQDLIEPYAFGKSFELNPLAVLLATTAGGILAGILGVLLALPLTNLVVQLRKRFKEIDASEDAPQEMNAAPIEGGG